MPVIAAGIVNKGGRIILSRQFTDITRIRIEGLLSAFPKLLSGNASKQYTVVETESVRYVYQPIEEVFLVLVTTKSSNIVEDLATLRLMGRLISENAPNPSEENISSKAFEILFAFDEVVTCGQRENVTMEQVISILEMHSHEEELALEEKRKAEQDAIRHAKLKAKELAEKRRENVLGDHHGGGSGGSSSGVGSSFGGMNTMDAPPVKSSYSEVAEDLAPKKASQSVGGMTLGKQKKTDTAAKMMAEMGAPASALEAARAGPSAGSPSPASTDPLNIRIVEKISVSLNKDGGFSGLDVGGDLFVHVADPSLGPVKIVLSRYSDAFSFKSHPNIDKQAFTADRVLLSKDGKPFPYQQSLGILRWRLQNAAGVKVPITMTCWPSDSGVSVEFELENKDMSLRNVIIAVPLGDAFPTVDNCSIGRYTHDGQKGVLNWHIGTVERGATDSGSLEISLNKTVNPSIFFPTRVDFVCNGYSVAGVNCVSVTNCDTGSAVPTNISAEITAGDYICA